MACYQAYAGTHRRLGALIDKIGFDEFKKAVLGDEAAGAAS